MPKQKDWLQILESASEPKKGTKIPKGMDLYAIMNAMNNAGVMMVMPGKGSGGIGFNQWNTGAGANGIVEPGKPVALDTRTNPPSVYHEGEPVEEFDGGRKITPAGVMPAETEREQQNLGIMEKEKNLPGYATGGTVYDDSNSITPMTSTRPTSEFSLSPAANEFQAGQQQAFRTTRQRASGDDPLMRNITNTALQNYDTRAAVSDTEAKQIAVSNPNLTTGAQNAIAAKEKATYRAGLSDLTGSLARENMARAETANTELYNMGRTGVQDDLSRQAQEKTFGEQQYQSDVSRNQWQQAFNLERQKYGDTEFSRMADDAQTTSLDTWLRKYPGSTAADYNTAREYKTKQLESMGIANLTASENYNQLKDSARWNEAENFLRAGDYANYAAIVKQVTGRDISTTEFAEDRKYLEMSRGQALTAGDIQNMAAQFGIDSNRLNAFITAVNNGADLASANAAAGLNLTQSQMDGITTRYRQEVMSNEIALDGARNALGDAVYNSIVSMVGNGSTLSAVNQRLSEQGKRPINMQEYSAMRGASNVGQMEWERQLQAFNTLVQSGDAANIRTAATQFSELFPGVTFSADQLISDIGAERFATAMTDLSTLANTFDTWDEAESSVEGLNLIESMGIGRGEAQDLFRSMKINAIDDEWNAISDSQWYKNLKTSDPTAAQLVQDTFAAGLTGELEFDIKPVFNVTDNSGKFVRAFDNIADANKFVGENSTAGYTIQEKQNYIYKDMNSGDTVVVNNGTGEATTLNGDGTPETVQTVAARFAKAGSDYTEDDIQAFKDANGRLPIDTKEMDTWDAKQYGIQFWDKMATQYPTGSFSVAGERPTVTAEDVKKIVEARDGGDKRADNFFVVKEDLDRINNAKTAYDREVDVGRGSRVNAVYATQMNNVREAITQNTGKIVSINGKNYIVLNESDDRKSFGLYDLDTKKSTMYDYDTVVRNGLSDTIKTPSSSL